MRITLPKTFTVFIALLVLTCKAKAQFDLLHLYPIGDESNIMYKTSYSTQERILFEANPIVRLSFYNQFADRMTANPFQRKASALYINFKPQLRMYQSDSYPVKMPSYKIQLSFQHLWFLDNGNFLTAGIETGHYSNGQNGSAFSDKFEDGSPQGDSIYGTITPQTNLSTILNRKSANFSTNLTELLFQYRINRYDNNKKWPKNVWTFNGGINFYHDRFWGIFPFGGYSDNDIRIYGNVRYNFGVSFSHAGLDGPGKATPLRWTLSEKMELIQGAHSSVNPLRSVTSFTFYPSWQLRAFGIFTSLTIGHDDYNYRFVDSGTQFGIGISWDCWLPVQINKGAPNRRYAK